MARGTQHTDETRAKVTAALLAGQGVREVSREFGVPVATVSRAKRDLAKPRAAHAISESGADETPIEKWRESRISPDVDGDFAPDDSATFDEDVEAGLRDEWHDSDDYTDARFGESMELSDADRDYRCPVDESKRGVPLEQVGTQKKERPSLDALIFDYLSENLATLRAQAIISRDPRWVKRYDPASLAILHGVIADKTIRILECAEAARPVEAEVVSSG